MISMPQVNYRYYSITILLLITILYSYPAWAQRRMRHLPQKTKQKPVNPRDFHKKPIPNLTRPVLFNTTTADRIISSIQILPKNNPWNEDISERPILPNSDEIIATMEPDNPLWYNLDMGFIIIPRNQKKVPVQIKYSHESEPGPFPIPDNSPIEGWPIYLGNASNLKELQREGRGDRHVLILDPYKMKIYECWSMYKVDDGWKAGSVAVFDLTSNKLRPDGWTSSDAAGLPIIPATVLYTDVQQKMVKHAMRFTARKSRKKYVYPATHHASRHTNKNYPRMGERLRLRKDFDTSGFSKHPKAILEGLKVYGMIMADNGLNWRISVAPDSRIKHLDELNRVKGSDFEVIIPTGPHEGPRAKR